MKILVLTLKKLTRSRFRYYVFIMHNHKLVICFSIQLLILPHVALICISCRSQRHEISALPNSRYLGILTNTMHYVPTVTNQQDCILILLEYVRILNLSMCIRISIQQMIILYLVMANTFKKSSHTIKTCFRQKI